MTGYIFRTRDLTCLCFRVTLKFNKRMFHLEIYKECSSSPLQSCMSWLCKPSRTDNVLGYALTLLFQLSPYSTDTGSVGVWSQSLLPVWSQSFLPQQTDHRIPTRVLCQNYIITNLIKQSLRQKTSNKVPRVSGFHCIFHFRTVFYQSTSKLTQLNIKTLALTRTLLTSQTFQFSLCLTSLEYHFRSPISHSRPSFPSTSLCCELPNIPVVFFQYSQ